MKRAILLACCCLGLLITLGVGCWFLAPKIEDTILSTVTSPSGKIKVTVIQREVGLLNPTSILIMLHGSDQKPQNGTPIIAITDGIAPLISFDGDAQLRVRLFGGAMHNQKKEALGIRILYE